MNDNFKLPSNRKFGFFFTFVFAVVAAYFYYSANIVWVYGFVSVASIFLLITLIKNEALLPLNKLWMRFGLLLGIIVSPIVLGIIFFVLTRFFLKFGILLSLFIQNLYFENLLCIAKLLFDTRSISQFNFAQKIDDSM